MSETAPRRPGPQAARGPLLRRRDVLALGALAAGGPAIATGGPALAQGSPRMQVVQALLGEGQRFDPAAVVEIARTLAKRPYTPLPNDLPDPLGALTYEQYVAIRALPERFVWAGEGRGFVVEPLHRGSVFAAPVTLYIVEDGTVRRVAYDRGRFDLGRIALPANVGDIGFSGFRLHASFGEGPPSEVAIVQGASFFRAIARGQNFGAVARGLTLRPADPKGEEFPFFRAFWLERPLAGSNALVVHALIDSESVSGAVRMTFRPGDMTIVDVETTLFPRVALEHVGIAGMASAYLFGPHDRRTIDDIRPAVHRSSGLRMHNGHGEWLWRPLRNPGTLQISAFVDPAPRGFGLMQRDRNYATFQDDEQRFERRPSLWIEPIGEWGPGAVQLIEIPSDSEVNDNILAYWRPRAAMPAGSEVAFAYRQFWCWEAPERPPLALVTGTRTGRGSNPRWRRFAVDFTGEAFAEPLGPEARAVANANPGNVHSLRVWRYPERKTVRVAFELEPAGDAAELRVALEAPGRPLSETWLYRWTP